jgi:hypothetical protein
MNKKETTFSENSIWNEKEIDDKVQEELNEEKVKKSVKLNSKIITIVLVQFTVLLLIFFGFMYYYFYNLKPFEQVLLVDETVDVFIAKNISYMDLNYSNNKSIELKGYTQLRDDDSLFSKPALIDDHNNYIFINGVTSKDYNKFKKNKSNEIFSIIGTTNIINNKTEINFIQINISEKDQLKISEKNISKQVAYMNHTLIENGFLDYVRYSLSEFFSKTVKK